MKVFLYFWFVTNILSLSECVGVLFDEPQSICGNYTNKQSSIWTVFTKRNRILGTAKLILKIKMEEPWSKEIKRMICLCRAFLINCCINRLYMRSQGARVRTDLPLKELHKNLHSIMVHWQFWRNI